MMIPLCSSLNNYLSTVGVVYAFVAKALAEVLTISGRQLTGKVLYRNYFC
jgi:hypothetical protein